jgi:hypothetical protein
MSPLSGRHSAAGRTVCLIMKRKFKTRSRVLRDEELNDVEVKRYAGSLLPTFDLNIIK